MKTHGKNPIPHLFLLISFCLPLLLTQGGCSRGIAKRGIPPGKVWTCDRETDRILESGDYEAAIRGHEALLERDPDNPLALYHLGYIYGQIGAHAKEIHCYERALALGFTEDGLFFNLGMAYGEAGRLKEALRSFRRGQERDPKNADNFFGEALVYQKTGKGLEEEKALLAALRIKPDHIEARLFLALLYEERGEMARAVREAREVLKIDPQNGEAEAILERRGAN